MSRVQCAPLVCIYAFHKKITFSICEWHRKEQVHLRSRCFTTYPDLLRFGWFLPGCRTCLKVTRASKNMEQHPSLLAIRWLDTNAKCRALRGLRCSRLIWCIQKLTCFCYISGNCGYQRLPKIFQSSGGCPIGRFHPMVVEKERRGFPPLRLHCSTSAVLFSNINGSREGK